jgi:hypothetical protein
VDFVEGSSFVLDNHLWVIISDLSQSNNEIVIVNITTCRGRDYEDTSCIVELNEHPWIKHRSYVFYRRSRVVDLSRLQLWCKTGDLRLQDSLSQVLLEKIRTGASKTEFLPFGVERVLSTQGII